ncbi:hypothetical protein [Pimelobacter simplex]|uniref:hypothetical protein n=1 Tax=Nocardioides simplex TaxID=2045 RepID=UPI001931D2C5|nr:hypothetical protein [Pimelobacter simplex]
MTDLLKAVQTVTVDTVEATCSVLDRVPWLYRTDDGWRWSRHGGIGCVLGISRLALRLDDRWETGHFQPVTQSSSE